MKRIKQSIVWGVIAAILAVFLVTGCGASDRTSGRQDTKAAVSARADRTEPESADPAVTEDGEYTSKEDVSLYLHLYEHLPDNYITKAEAKALGWNSSEGNLWDVAPGKSIGGDSFGNREGLLPEKKSRKYYECDIDYQGGYRSAERIIYSSDGLIYYTEDHYNTFELLYGEDDG